MVLPPVLQTVCVEGDDFALDRLDVLVGHVCQGQALPEFIRHAHRATVVAYARRGELVCVGVLPLEELEHVCSGRVVLEARRKGARPRHGASGRGSEVLLVTDFVSSPHGTRLRHDCRRHAGASLEQGVKFLAKEVVA